MIDRGAGFISTAVEPVQGLRSGGKGVLAEARLLLEARRVGGSQNMRFTVIAIRGYGALSLISDMIAPSGVVA